MISFSTAIRMLLSPLPYFKKLDCGALKLAFIWMYLLFGELIVK